MENDDIVATLCIIIIANAVKIIRKRQRRRRQWTRPWIQRRSHHGAHHALLQELTTEDPDGFRNFLRMDKADFDELLTKVTPLIHRQDTWMREAISVSERLSITLRYLATGDSYQSLEYLYRIPKSTLSSMIPETCQAIYDCLRDEYMKVSKTFFIPFFFAFCRNQ